MNSADSIGNNSSRLFHAIHFRGLQLLITVALILCIVGGTSSTSSTGVYQPQTTTKAGVVLYVVAFIVLVLIAAIVASKLSNAPREDKRLVWAVIIAFPFILVRIIYSLISVFSHNSHFNLITGSVIIHVFMSVLEEMVVVIIYLAIGWKLEAVSRADRGPIASRPWKGNLEGRDATRGGNLADRDPYQGDNLAERDAIQDGNLENGAATQEVNEKKRRHGRSGRRMRHGPIHSLVNAGIAAAQRKG
jgi:hypothetical protein